MKRRAEALKQITAHAFDLCVIGGGATGAGCALDAQLRGLKTVLLEGADFAAAASSASTKLAHGGVRYLEQAVKKLDIAEYRMVQRALRERLHMLQNAPHLAHAVEFLLPVFSWSQAFYYRTGMKLYDWLSGDARLSPSRFLRREEVLRRMPALAPDRLYGAVAYADGQFDDSRYALALLQSFVASGGEALNYARVASFAKSPDGRLAAGVIDDGFSKQRFIVRARAFVNATGAASDAVRQMANPDTAKRLRPSKGVHILLPLESFASHDALLVPKTEDGRVVFAIPWPGRLLVGTTDDEVAPETRMIVLRQEAEYLLRQLNPYLARSFRPEQIVSGISGLRPLVAAGKGRNTKELLRDHEVEVDAATGLISILGGKWTTYRLMAEETIDAVQGLLGGPVTSCRTREFPLAGAAGYWSGAWRELAAKYGVADDTARHLAQKFGGAAEEVLSLARSEPALAARLLEGLPHIHAEVVYAIRNEMAMTIEDVLARRIGLQLYDWRKALHAAPAVASQFARELGWTAAETQQAIAAYAEKINDFLAALGLPAEPALQATDLRTTFDPM